MPEFNTPSEAQMRTLSWKPRLRLNPRDCPGRLDADRSARAGATGAQQDAAGVLIKVTLLTFNDANVTGNYTVLHAKLSKPFRDQFPPRAEGGVQDRR